MIGAPTIHQIMILLEWTSHAMLEQNVPTPQHDTSALHILQLSQIKCARRAQRCSDAFGHALTFANQHWIRFDYAFRVMLPFANLVFDEVPFEII